MKYLIRAAFAVVSLATIAPVANAQSYSHSAPTVAQHQGPYDNTANSLGGRFAGGGD